MNNILFGLGMVCTVVLGYVLITNRATLTPEPEMTCLSAQMYVEAMRSCLEVQPACVIPDGVTAFVEYYEAGSFLIAFCGVEKEE